jgi:hypothetical protein
MKLLIFIKILLKALTKGLDMHIKLTILSVTSLMLGNVSLDWVAP